MKITIKFIDNIKVAILENKPKIKSMEQTPSAKAAK